jgi:hypothetical protein
LLIRIGETAASARLQLEGNIYNDMLAHLYMVERS